MRDSAVVLLDRPTSVLKLDGQHFASRPEKKVGQQRRYAPKTRTGCVTCKIRRVKCDESKPFCNRCTTTGRKCDGYLTPDSSPKSPEPLTVALVNDISADALERRTFDFFRNRTAPCVSGHFQDSVWDRIVLQLSHSEPAVRHAVNALGALHEERWLRDRAGREGGTEASIARTGFPQKQYAKALSEMQNLLTDSSTPLDTILLCALLCVHFEALRECFVPAMLHCENAISMLQSQNSKFDARKINPSLVRAMMRMDLQGSFYLGVRVPGMSFYTAATDSILPNSFHDLTQARDLIHFWTCRIYHFMRTVADEHKFQDPGDVPLEDYAKSQELEQIFRDLDAMLWDFMHKPTAKLTMREQHGLSLLRSRVKMNRMLAASCLHSEATIFDQWVDEFQDILTNCLYIMSSEHADKRLISISLDEGLVQPLWFVATNCRDSRIRHTALDYLKRLPAQDSIWHVETTIKTAEFCILWEESNCSKEFPRCEDIPEWKRVQSAVFDGWEIEGPVRRVHVHFRTKPNGSDGGWADFTESIDCQPAWVDWSQWKTFVGSVNRDLKSAADLKKPT